MTIHSASRFVLVAAGSVLLLSGGPAPADDTGSVKVLRVVPIAEKARVPQKVRSECGLQDKVPAFLSNYARNVELVDRELGTRGRILELHIGDVHAPGGGAFSGPKWMTVTGVLRENGREVGSFTAKRFSGGGMFGAYKGTCAIVERCARAIGKDIAGWLRSPRDGARLGDA
jgi:hypothetical protein